MSDGNKFMDYVSITILMIIPFIFLFAGVYGMFDMNFSKEGIIGGTFCISMGIATFFIFNLPKALKELFKIMFKSKQGEKENE